MKKKALIVQGGWERHEPEKVAAIYKEILEDENFVVEEPILLTRMQMRRN